MAAIESGWRDLKEAWAYFATGHVDDTLQDAALDLGCEVVRSADGLESVSTAASILHEVVAGLAARRVQLQTSRHYRAALRALRQLHLRSDLPPDLRAVTDDALGLLASTAAASHVGRIKRFSRARRWGFITCDDHEYFFHVSELQSPDEAIFLVEGLPVEFNVGEGREGRPQAEDVRPAPATDEGVLFKRRARVEAIKQHYCFAIDEQTEATVFVSKAAFENRRAFDGLAVGDILLADYELGGEGPRAKRESARVVRPAEWDHQRFR